MKTIKNYHPTSMKYEDKFIGNLLDYYGILLVNLNSIKQLTETEIKKIIQNWKEKYKTEIDNTIEEHINSLDRFSNKMVVSKESVTSENNLKDKLIASSKRELELTTDQLQLNFDKLATYEKDINYSPEIADERLKSIANDLSNSIGLFATMSTISALRELTFGNAESQGYTEYLWVTQRDSKVRPDHAAMDGKWIKINDPAPQPLGMQIGMDYNCRCYIGGFR